MKKYKEFINEEVVNEELVWFRHFNKESDNFMDLLDAVISGNKIGFVEVVDEFVLKLSKGEIPRPEIFNSIINDKVYEEYYNLGVKRGVVYSFEKFKSLLKEKNSDTIFPLMLYKGVKSDMLDGGSDLLEYTTGESRKYLEDLSIDRGKDKLEVMLKNKGILNEEE